MAWNGQVRRCEAGHSEETERLGRAGHGKVRLGEEKAG